MNYRLAATWNNETVLRSECTANVAYGIIAGLCDNFTKATLSVSGENDISLSFILNMESDSFVNRTIQDETGKLFFRLDRI